MELEYKETAAPTPPVAADGEQPISETVSNIPDIAGEYNPAESDLSNYFREMERMSDPSYLHTFTMNELFDNTFSGRTPLIDDLLPFGTYFLAGAPKVGKSFLVAQIAYHVSMGRPLWDYPVQQGGVLYLALEDDHQRLQARMSRMFGVEGTDDLNFAIYSGQVGATLEDQLDNYLRKHPGTKLVIIDTLQKIRGDSGEAYSYAADYKVVGQLKHFADRKGICLLLVHHTRKQSASDAFDMISGTTGLLGCADGAFVLKKVKRTDLSATLSITSRDLPDQKLYLIRDEEHLTWQLDHTETQPWKAQPDPLLEKIASLISEDNPVWTGSATELLTMLGEDMKPNILTRRLNVKSSDLKTEHGIAYAVSHTRNGSCIKLSRVAQKT